MKHFLFSILLVFTGLEYSFSQPNTINISDQTKVGLDLDWEMTPRFGLDLNKNGLMDLPNTFEYANPNLDYRTHKPKFEVTLKALPVLPLDFPYDFNDAKDRKNFRFDWVINDQQQSSKEPYPKLLLEEAIHEVKLQMTITMPDGKKASKSITKLVPINDLLIVAIGDSYSSGEGNPEKFMLQKCNEPHFRVNKENTSVLVNDGKVKLPSRNPDDSNDFWGHAHVFTSSDGYPGPIWADDGTTIGNSGVALNHHRAHRSTLSWPAQAAYYLEKEDPHTSVTFIHLAQSGATIDEGVLGSYYGIKNDGGKDDFSYPMSPQLIELKSIIKDRGIDALTITIGGNDIGFSRIIHSLILIGGGSIDVAKKYNEKAIKNTGIGVFAESFLDKDHEGRIDKVELSVLTGSWHYVYHQKNKDSSPLSGLNGLKPALDKLKKELDKNFRIYNTYVLGYPNPTSTKDGNGNLKVCNKIISDVMYEDDDGDIIGLNIGKKEEEAMVASVLNPLNLILSTFCKENPGWEFMHSESYFNGHGYCVEGPKEYYGNQFPNEMNLNLNSDISWFRSAVASGQVQGPRQIGDLGAPYATYGTNYSYENTKGTIHPNEFGHAAAKTIFFEYYVAPNNLYRYDPDDEIMEAKLVSQKDTIAGLISPSSWDVDMYYLWMSKNSSLKVSLDNPENANQESRLRLKAFSFGGDNIELMKAGPGNHHLVVSPFMGRVYFAVSGPSNQLFDPVTGEDISDLQNPALEDIGPESLTMENLHQSDSGNVMIHRQEGLPKQLGQSGYEPNSYRIFFEKGIDPDNTISKANKLGKENPVEGFSLETSNDVDVFRYEIKPVDVNKTIRISALPHKVTKPSGTNSPLFEDTSGKTPIKLVLMNQQGRKQEERIHSLEITPTKPGALYIAVMPGYMTISPKGGIIGGANKTESPIGMYKLSFSIVQ